MTASRQVRPSLLSPRLSQPLLCLDRGFQVTTPFLSASSAGCPLNIRVPLGRFSVCGQPLGLRWTRALNIKPARVTPTRSPVLSLLPPSACSCPLDSAARRSDRLFPFNEFRAKLYFLFSPRWTCSLCLFPHFSGLKLQNCFFLTSPFQSDRSFVYV